MSLSKDFVRCLPIAQVVYQELASAKTPETFYFRARDAYNDVAAADRPFGYELPRTLAFIAIAEQLYNGTAADFAATFHKLTDRDAACITGLTVEQVALVTGQSQAETAGRLTRLGYDIENGAVARHTAGKPQAPTAAPAAPKP